MMTLVLIILFIIVTLLILITIYTSVNSRATKFGEWFERLLDDKPGKNKD